MRVRCITEAGVFVVYASAVRDTDGTRITAKRDEAVLLQGVGY